MDGDTIKVILDLGFDTFHREILRLKGVNADEAGTEGGNKSTKSLNKILKDVPFLIIKTIKVDIYGRYVADVFLASLDADPQQVADSGVYLNQLLLDKGSVQLWDGN